MFYPHYFWQWIVSFLCRFFSFLYHRQNLLPDLTIYIWVTWWASYKKRNCLPFASRWVHPEILVGSMLLNLLVFCFVLWFCVLFVLVFVLCIKCCQFIWIVHAWFPFGVLLRLFCTTFHLVFSNTCSLISRKNSLKIPKGQSESVNWRRTDNTMAKRKSTKEQTTKHTHKTKNRVTRTSLKTGVNSGAPEG